MRESELRESIVRFGRLLREAGLAPGSSGNISVRLEDDSLLVTPTNACMGALDPADIAKLDRNGTHLAGHKPSKEAPLHDAVYRTRGGVGAIVHTHSTHAVSWAIRDDVDPEDVLPPITAYYLMRVGSLPLVPYYPPGDPGLVEAIADYAIKSPAMLLANHGPILAAKDLDAAVYGMEELEETAKLAHMLDGRPMRTLTPEQIGALRERFGGSQ